MRRRNKKGYIKTLEAVISIVGILMFTFGVTPREVPNPNQVPFVVENAQNYIIEQIQNDEVLRQRLVNSTWTGDAWEGTDFVRANDTISLLIANNLPPGYTYEYKICVNTYCLAETPPIDVSVYMDDTLIAGINDAASPEPRARIVRLWLWSLG